MDQLPRSGKRELICLLSFTCNYVVSVWRGFFFLWVLGMGYVILLWHSLSLPLINFIIILWLSVSQRWASVVLHTHSTSCTRNRVACWLILTFKTAFLFFTADTRYRRSLIFPRQKKPDGSSSKSSTNHTSLLLGF